MLPDKVVGERVCVWQQCGWQGQCAYKAWSRGRAFLYTSLQMRADPLTLFSPPSTLPPSANR